MTTTRRTVKTEQKNSTRVLTMKQEHWGGKLKPTKMCSWVVTPHEYGISAFVPQMSFCMETSSEVAKHWLFSQANQSQVISIQYVIDAVSLNFLPPIMSVLLITM